MRRGIRRASKLVNVTGMSALLLTTGISAWPPDVRAQPYPACRAQRDAWACVRAVIPAHVAVLRPTWAPARFHSEPTVVGVHDDRSVGVNYEVGYSNGRQGITFYLGAANGNGTVTSDTTIRVRGATGHLVTAIGNPPIMVTWWEGGRFHIIQGHGINRLEMLRIVASLVPVTPTTGAHAS